MKTISHPARKPEISQTVAKPHADAWSDEAVEEEFKPLSSDEAAQWRTAQRPLSVAAVLLWQVGLALLCAGLAAAFGDAVVVRSVLYGAAAVILPTALMVWGMTYSPLVKPRGGGAQASLVGFFVWEGIKLLLVIALLGLAPVVLDVVNWLALVVGFVVVLKAYGLVLLIQSRRRR